MDNKENLFTIEEDLDMSSFSRLRTAQKSSKKSGRCNLRKSLAWNNAFFTEEGVLDPMELSVLSGSSMKSKESALSMTNGHTSPPLGVHKSGDATPPNSVGQKFFCKMHSQSRSKNSKRFKDGNLVCKLDASNQEEQQEIMASGAIPSSKNTTKGVPRPAATSSYPFDIPLQDKGFSGNPPSKIPKFTPTKSYASLPATPPGDTIPALKNKFEKNSSTVSTELNPGTKFVPSNMGKPLSYAQSLKPSATDLSRPFVPLDKSRSCSKSTSGSSASEVVQGTNVPCSSFKGSSSLHKNANHVAADAVAPVQAKPSALRMPSPSLGFFQQGRFPHATQPQRNLTQFQPTMPLIKATNVKQADELRFLPSSSGQKSIKDPPAPKSFGRTTSSSKMYNSLLASSLHSSNGNVVQPSKNVSTMQRDINIGAPGESDGQLSAQQALKRHHLEVDINIDNLPQVLSSKKPEPNIDKKVPCASNSMLELDKKPVRGIYSTKESLKVSSVSEDPCPPTRKRCSNGFESSENSCQTCFMGKPNETQINEGVSEVDNQVKQSLLEYTSLVNNAVSEQDGCPAGNLYLSRDGEFGLSDRVADSSTVPINKSSLTLNKVKVVCSAIVSSSEAGCSLAEETVIEDDFRINNRTSVSLEEIKSSLRLSTEQSSGFGSTSNLEMDDSQSLRTGVPSEKAHSRTNALAVRLINSSEDSQPAQSMDCKVHDSTVQSGKEDLINLEKESLLLNGGKNEQKDKVKQDIGHLKHQFNASPFSEEWLTAIETFGEEILELKTGPVQNSPPDKTLPEPSPWSPVKRKAQDIGPFVCTKKHSTNLSTSGSS